MSVIKLEQLIHPKKLCELKLPGRFTCCTKLKSGQYAVGDVKGNVHILNKNTLQEEQNLIYVNPNEEHKVSGDEYFDILEEGDLDGSFGPIKTVGQLDDGRILAWIRGHKIKTWDASLQYQEIPIEVNAEKIFILSNNRAAFFREGIFQFYNLVAPYQVLGTINIRDGKDEYENFVVELYEDKKRNQLLCFNFTEYKGVFNMKFFDLSTYTVKSKIERNDINGMWPRNERGETVFFPANEDKMLIIAYSKIVVLDLDKDSIEKIVPFGNPGYYGLLTLPFYIKEEKLPIITIKMENEQDMDGTIDDVEDNSISYINIKTFEVENTNDTFKIFREPPTVIDRHLFGLSIGGDEDMDMDDEEKPGKLTGLVIYSYE